MADTPIHQRRFSDDEVRAILKKAVERSSSHALTRSDGLSLEELKDVAAEVGVDPARIEDAARSVVAGSGGRANLAFGGPTRVHFERRAEGELAPEDAHEALALVRRVMGRQGEVQEVHGSLEWNVQLETGERSLTVSTRDGVTTVRGAANMWGLALLTFLPPGAIGAILSLVSFAGYTKTGSSLALLLAVVILPVLYAVLRTIYGSVSRAEAAKVEQVVDEVARLAERSS